MAPRRHAAPLRPLRGTLVLLSVLATSLAARAAAQDTVSGGALVTVRDVGPGVVGRLLRDVLAHPHRVLAAPDTGIVLGRDTDVPTALVVLGGPARLEGRVRGDVVVLGDAVLRPGALVDGRVISIGGIIANSSLAVVRGPRLEFRDETFTVTQTGTGTYALNYRLLARSDVPRVSLPGIFGFGIPTYDRVNGASLTWGPEIALDTGHVRIRPDVTYRSQLGAIDPGVRITLERGRRTRASLDLRRDTRTNERWIYSDLVNSALALFAGSDMRNYYRADRGELHVERDVETTTAVLTPYVGVATERAWSAARSARAPSAPYSVLARHDSVKGMRRPNPGVTGGRITSALAGASARVLRGRFTATGTLGAEIAPRTDGHPSFTQLTFDGNATVPTFGTQRLVAIAHAVSTLGPQSIPTQRYAYLGGGGTIPTLDPLVEGGDELAWIDGRYVVPIPIHLPLANESAVALRYIVGAAGVSYLPSATQNVGVRLTVGFLRADFLVDPANTHRHTLSFGIGFR